MHFVNNFAAPLSASFKLFDVFLRSDPIITEYKIALNDCSRIILIEYVAYLHCEHR